MYRPLIIGYQYQSRLMKKFYNSIKMPTDGNKVGKWNLGFGSNMNVKNVREKKLVKVLGKYSTRWLEKMPYLYTAILLPIQGCTKRLFPG